MRAILLTSSYYYSSYWQEMGQSRRHRSGNLMTGGEHLPVCVAGESGQRRGATPAGRGVLPEGRPRAGHPIHTAGSSDHQGRQQDPRGVLQLLGAVLPQPRSRRGGRAAVPAGPADQPGLRHRHVQPTPAPTLLSLLRIGPSANHGCPVLLIKRHSYSGELEQLW